MSRMGSTPGNRGKDSTPYGPQLVAVAVDADKSSRHALKWAADHIIPKGEIFVLIHIRKKITTIPTPTGQHLPISEVNEEVASTFLEQVDSQTQEILLPFQCFCSRRGMNCKEVILDGTNIAKTIVDFVVEHSVDKLVLGLSSRNAFTRAFKPADVPTSIAKNAPEFCSVYVISKGKIYSARPATNPKKYPVDRICKFGFFGNQFQSTKGEMVVRNHIETSGRSALSRSGRSGGGNSGRYRKTYRVAESFRGVDRIVGTHDFSFQTIVSCPSPGRTDIEEQSSYLPPGSLDGGRHESLWSGSNNENAYVDKQNGCYVDKQNGCLDLGRYDSNAWPSDYAFKDYGHSPFVSKGGLSSVNNSVESIDCEMSRLELQLKLAVDKYDNASREAHHDRELAIEEPRMARESTLELAEKEHHRIIAQVFQQKMKAEASKEFDTNDVSVQVLAEKFSSDARYRRYTIEEIQKATNGFSDVLKIGEGGYGSVFKTTLDHTPVAIKVPRCNLSELVKQFQKEVEVLSCIRHPNMVLLLGACPEYGCLVYEHMTNGSLEDRLFCRSGTAPLSWQLRFKIAAEVATGLLFLHQTKPEPLVHRDLKPANILLDNYFTGKISDVGLARLLPPSAANATQYLATSATGTFCYIDPEYQKTGTVGVKSDVYALGIILLQIITAKQPMGLTHAVETAMAMGRFEEVLDPNVPYWPMESTEKLAKLALKCAELQRKDRPDLASVVLPVLNQLRELADSTMGSMGSHYH